MSAAHFSQAAGFIESMAPASPDAASCRFSAPPGGAVKLKVTLTAEGVGAIAVAGARLASVLEPYAPDHRNVYLLSPASHQSLPRIKAFVHFMVERKVSIGGQPGTFSCRCSWPPR